MNCRIKICIGHYSASNDVSGVTTWLSNFIETINQEPSIDLHVLLIEYGEQNHVSDIKQKLRHNNISFTVIPNQKYTIDTVRLVLTFFEQHQFSLFIPHCIEALYYAAINLSKQGLPFVYTMHSDDPVYWANAELLNKYAKPIAISVSKDIANEYTKRFNIQPTIIPYGFKTHNTIVRNIDATRLSRIVYIGRIVEEQKRISLVYETMAALCKINEDVQCTIVGSGPAEEWLKEKLTNYNANSRIQYAGRVKPDDMAKLLGVYGIQLLMSDYEGLPVSMLECMSLGVIPATRNIKSGINELIENGVSGIILPDDPQLAATKLNTVIVDVAFCQNASELSVAIAGDFTLDQNIKRWLQLIQKHAAKNTVCIKGSVSIKMPTYVPVLGKRYKTKPNIFYLLKDRIQSRIRK